MSLFSYDPNRIFSKMDESIFRDDVLSEFSASDFKVGINENPAKQQSYKLCGGIDFHVAKDDYYTAIRCVKCRVEVCVHEG